MSFLFSRLLLSSALIFLSAMTSRDGCHPSTVDICWSIPKVFSLWFNLAEKNEDVTGGEGEVGDGEKVKVVRRYEKINNQYEERFKLYHNY